MYKLTPPAKRALAAYAAADDTTRMKLARPGLGPDGMPLPMYAKRGYKAATSYALAAWRALVGYEAGSAYRDVQLLALRATLRNPKLTHRDRPLEGRPPFEAAADLEAQGVLVAILALDPESGAYVKLTAAWRKAGLPL